MEFGINNLVKSISPLVIARQIRRYMDLSMNKGKNLKLPLSYNIQNTKFGKNNYIGENVTINNSSMDDYSYINMNSIIRNTVIGKFCSIGSNVQIVLGKHPIDFVSIHPAFYSNNKFFTTFSDKNYLNEYDKVEIGNDVWIAEGVVIPGGITIGNGAIVMARAVVTKNVEPFSIVGGIPARHIKYRFEKDIADKLNAIEWWNWEESFLKENFRLFHDPIKLLDYLSKLK